jgi:drug/metabolite transporter (DMT)-like permease
MKWYKDASAFTILVAAKGFSFPAFEAGLTAFPALFLAALRFDVACIILFMYIFSRGQQWRPKTQSDYIAIFSGGVLIFTFSTGVWSIGQDMTTSTLAGLMASLVPIATAGFSWLLIPKDRLSLIGVVGLGVGFMGALLIMVPASGIEFGPSTYGKVLIFLGVLGTSLGAVLIRWAKPSIPASTQTAWAVGIGAISLHLISIGIENPIQDSTVTPVGIFAVLFLGIVSSALGRGMFFWLIGHRSAIEISITSYLAPVIAALSGWLIFSEELTLSMILGFVVVLIGFTLMKRKGLHNYMFGLKSTY